MKLMYATMLLVCIIISAIEIYECMTGGDRSKHWRKMTLCMLCLCISFAADMLYSTSSHILKDSFSAYFLNHIYNWGMYIGLYFWFVYAE